ncbi:heterokaryon incompatibility protein-domain-containing protein [Aspergillus bertholletiae]|uniref:Heterokaryon incompatibility protein-domain-containing protein n=1 Tax=Aspergillus bertholletiae TaxID=1226010 RepID=A0A5N7BLK6_9EURO|nr:heterokaryon incompatibility protein-domain-containing protein [Aspergillus bertholletiae]
MCPKSEHVPYSTLRLGPNMTRLVRLLPPEKDGSRIECELFNYILPERSVRKHLYEALSYVWGSESKPCTIFLNGIAFPVTKNLYTALLHLRDPQLARTIWVDAICIDQDNDDEKSIQIPLMRAIYAQADRVIVWLGEAIEDGDNALKRIHRLAEDQSLQDKSLLAQSHKTSDDACLKLLQREWFQRIWVLQEVGVARYISIICGSVQINGHVFCEGLSILGYSLDLPRTIRPVVHLIKGALFRPSYEIDSCGTLAIGELLDMYRNHHATILHDKVYALLGLSAEDADKTDLKPNYRLQWNDVFKKVAMHVFPGAYSVETWLEIPVAVIEGRGWVLGYVDSVEENTFKYGYQQININYNNTAQLLGCQNKWGTQWTLQVYAESIQKGNIICLLQGAPSPIIIELCNDHFTVIISTVTLQSGGNIKIPDMESINDIYMTWEISLADKESNSGLRDQRELTFVAPHYQENISLIIRDIIIQMLENKDPKDQIGYLLRCCGKSLAISEDVVKAAAANTGIGIWGGYMIMQLLHKHCGKSLPISEDVVKAAVANNRSGHEIMQLLCRHYKKSLLISEDVVKAAAANTEHGLYLMELLREYYGKSLPISEDVVKAAAANTEHGPKIMQLLREHCGKSLPI